LAKEGIEKMARPIELHSNMGRDILGLINTYPMNRGISMQLRKTNPQNNRVISIFDTIIKV
jgi:hypothetical protein